MAWAPGPRAPWVGEANRGERPEFLPSPTPFDVDDLVGVDEGIDDIDPRILEPLALICHGLEHDARLTPLGRWATERYLARLVDGHRALVRYVAADPEVVAEPIASPIFVVGAPRTGTTAMHRLLAADPAHRVPEGWEFLYPVPPPTPDGLDTDDRVARAGDELAFPQTVSEGLRSIHAYSARMPKECLSAMAFSFRSEEFVSRYRLPGYRAWLSGCDMGPAYEMHRTVLRVLQRRMPRRRWVLKSPVHLQAIPELVATYPDARFVITHREPTDVIASVSSLIATLRSAFSDEVDAAAIGRYHLELYASSLTRLVEHVDGGRLPVDRTVHVQHAGIVARPDEVVAAVYRDLDLDLTDAVRSAAHDVATTAREDGVGAHRYSLADFGLDESDLVAPFAAYRARFLQA